MAALNREALARRDRDWAALPDHPRIGRDSTPPFADDLDLFGTASLFGLLGTVATPPGVARLQSWMLQTASAETVARRQGGVRQLAPHIDVRQEVTAAGRRIATANLAGVERFLAWAESEPWLASRRWVIWTARALTLATVALVVANVLGVVSYQAWLAAIAVNLAFSHTVGKGIHRTFDRAFTRESAFKSYARIFELFVATPFSAPRLQELQSELIAGDAIAHREIERLHRLLSLSEVRFSMPYVAIQAFSLWDFHVLARLEGWQVRAGHRARRWLDALAELDAIAALAALHYDNPDWAFPVVRPQKRPVIGAAGLGHPLIPDDRRVVNDVSIGPPGTFLLVTGSNMSGKSTLLRAIGTNVILARAGAPVCATSMRLPPIALETSMRVHDSLQAGLSHFMAELERLKRVVAAARQAGSDPDVTLLYLLDDIFQGTNTAERQIAARKVVDHLLEAGAIGAVTSHDLALADTDRLSGACDPVHFTESIVDAAEGPRITFDYKLQPGIATSRNALRLLEIVGLGSSTDGPPTANDSRPWSPEAADTGPDRQQKGE